MRPRQGEGRRDSFRVKKEKENEPWVPRFSTLCHRMSECRNARVRERERESRRVGTAFKHGRKGGVICVEQRKEGDEPEGCLPCLYDASQHSHTKTKQTISSRPFHPLLFVVFFSEKHSILFIIS